MKAIQSNRTRLAALAAALTLASLVAASQEPLPADETAGLAGKAAALKSYTDETVFPAVISHARTIASFGSRQTGQDGCDLTARYIRDYLAEAGLENVTLSTAPVTAPVAGEASLALASGREVEVFPMLPNGVQPCATPPDGIRGSLVYIGTGKLDDLNGKDLSGAIVLMDYNSGGNWMVAMEFGALAAVFIEPDLTTWRQTDGKYIDHLPLNFPRVYVRRDAAEILLEAARRSESVTLRSEMALDNVPGPWVEGYLPGTAG
ncbi:MAG: protease-associated domain-containing protein, partial [Planctomycetota bacterium]